MKSNSYLQHLTNGERSPNWFWMLGKYWLVLWFMSSILIQGSVSKQVFWIIDETAIIGLPLSILVVVLFLTWFLYTGNSLVLTESRKEQFALLRLTNIAPNTILTCLVFGVIYHARRWLTWVIGGGPLLTWVIC